jgi:hypothetical protein
VRFHQIGDSYFALSVLDAIRRVDPDGPDASVATFDAGGGPGVESDGTTPRSRLRFGASAPVAVAAIEAALSGEGEGGEEGGGA